MPWYDNDDESVFVAGLNPGNNATYWGKVTSGISGNITEVRSKFTGILGTPFGVRIAVYSNDGPEPGDLLGNTLDATITDAGDTIPELDLVSPVYVRANESVWIGVQIENPGSFRSEPLSSLNTTTRSDIGWTGGFPDPANAPTTTTNAIFASIFVVQDFDADSLPNGTVFVTDGTERIDLNNCGRIYIDEWVPFVPGPKGNGTWRESSLSPGRQLVDWQWENWVDVFNLGMHNITQDKLIRQEQDLQRLLVKAHQYWTTDWQNEPVWLEARAPCESHTRYAVIKSWRTPIGSGNPFQQPFSLIGQRKSAIENFQLTIEHGPWLSDQPGTGRCVQISGTQESYPFHMEFTEITSDIDCGSDAALDNLPSAGDFTIEAWVYADGWGDGLAGNFARIADKSTGIVTAGWTFLIDPSFGLSALYAYTITDAYSASGIDDFSPDSQWHHVAAVWDNGTATATLYIDGVEPSYTSQTAGAGAYVADAALDFHIGNRQSAPDSAWEGKIGWVRLSNNARYTASFTPPDRCALPAIDANTIAQWIGPEDSGATIDNQEGTAALDGTQTDCDFDFDCAYGRTETCEDEVYIANKHNRAQLTHIFVDDGGVFGANLMGAVTPFLFLPAVPAVNDAVYFGIDTSFDDSGPFSSLVFDILTAQTDITTIAWEFWNGAAWAALVNNDNTNEFSVTGVNSVHWEQQQIGGWSTTTVNGITGYWIRARVSVIGAAPTGPYQQNRDIYTILWPYIEIDDAQVLGDIEFALRAKVSNQSSNAPSNTTDLSDDRIIFGLRSTDRGERYTPYINMADEQNDSGILIGVDTNTAFATDVESHTGRTVVYTPVGVEALARRAFITFDDTITSEYMGIFHAYLRCSQNLGAVDDFNIQLRIVATEQPVVVTEILPKQLAGTFLYEVVDFGQIRLPGYITPAGYVPDQMRIDIYASAAAAGGRALTLYDLILFPVDEWSADITDPTNESNIGSSITDDDYLDLDGATFPKETLSFVRGTDDDSIQVRYNQVSAAAPLLHPNQTQRLWFFSNFHPAASPAFDGRSETAHTIQIEGTACYLYARGDR